MKTKSKEYFRNYKVGDILIPTGDSKTLVGFDLTKIVELEVTVVYSYAATLKLKKLSDEWINKGYDNLWSSYRGDSWLIEGTVTIYNFSALNKSLKHKVKEDSYTIGF